MPGPFFYSVRFMRLEDEPAPPGIIRLQFLRFTG